MKAWEVVKSRYLLQRWWMSLREDHVRLPGGAEMPEFHVVEYPDWSCVVCFDEKGRVVIVEQYRHGIGRSSMELPAGAADPGEDPLTAAKRELREETGYEAEEWAYLGRCAPEPSKHTNYAHLYVARGGRRNHEQQLDHGEEIRVHLVEPAEVLRLVEEGDLVHGIHLAALFWAHYRGFFLADLD